MHTTIRTAGFTFAASLGLHGLLVLLAAWLITVLPVLDRHRPLAPTAAASEPVRAEEPEIPDVEVTFMAIPPASPELKPEPAPPAHPDSAASAKVTIIAGPDQPALAPLNVDTPFISSRNMRASSRSAPMVGGDPNLPSQDGYKLPGLSLNSASYSDGNNGSAGADQPPRPDAPTPPSDPSPPSETPPATPPPPASDQRPPEPSAMVRTTDPLAPAPADKPAEPIPMRDRPPEPLPLTNPVASRPKSPSRPPVDPVTASDPGGRPGRRPVVSAVKNKTEGALAIRGDESSVDAKDSPEGRYNNAVYERVGLLWNSKLATVRGLAGIGSVEVEFDIDARGRVSNVRLVDPGKANPVLEDVCLTAIINAKLPAPPASMQREMADPLTGGKLRRKFTFTRL